MRVMTRPSGAVWTRSCSPMRRTSHSPSGSSRDLSTSSAVGRCASGWASGSQGGGPACPMTSRTPGDGRGGAPGSRAAVPSGSAGTPPRPGRSLREDVPRSRRCQSMRSPTRRPRRGGRRFEGDAETSTAVTRSRAASRRRPRPRLSRSSAVPGSSPAASSTRRWARRSDAVVPGVARPRIHGPWCAPYPDDAPPLVPRRTALPFRQTGGRAATASGPAGTAWSSRRAPDGTGIPSPCAVRRVRRHAREQAARPRMARAGSRAILMVMPISAVSCPKRRQARAAAGDSSSPSARCGGGAGR